MKCSPKGRGSASLQVTSSDSFWTLYSRRSLTRIVTYSTTRLVDWLIAWLVDSLALGEGPREVYGWSRSCVFFAPLFSLFVCVHACSWKEASKARGGKNPNVCISESHKCGVKSVSSVRPPPSSVSPSPLACTPRGNHSSVVGGGAEKEVRQKREGGRVGAARERKVHEQFVHVPSARSA